MKNVSAQTLAANLESHDWFFNFSDDGSVWRKGRGQRETIQWMCKQLISSKVMTSSEVSELWNKFAPNSFLSKPSHFEG